MEFEYIGNANEIANRLLFTGIGFGIGGLVLAWMSFARRKRLLYGLASAVLIGVGGYYAYQSSLLERTNGEWQIRISADTIDWQSPDERIDRSFTLELAEIDHLRVDIYSHRREHLDSTSIRLVNGDRIDLTAVSGVNLAEVAEHLEQAGVKVERHRR